MIKLCYLNKEISSQKTVITEILKMTSDFITLISAVVYNFLMIRNFNNKKVRISFRNVDLFHNIIVR